MSKQSKPEAKKDKPLNLRLNKYAAANKRPTEAGFFQRNQNHSIGTEIKKGNELKSPPPKKKVAVKKPAAETQTDNQGDK
jgi:hypothetical protein